MATWRQFRHQETLLTMGRTAHIVKAAYQLILEIHREFKMKTFSEKNVTSTSDKIYFLVMIKFKYIRSINTAFILLQ